MKELKYDIYKILDFDKKLEEIFNSNSKKKEQEIKKYLDDNIEKLAKLISDINIENIEKASLEIIKICVLLDSINYNNSKLPSKIDNYNNNIYIKLIKNIIDNNLIKVESNNMVNMITYYYSKYENISIDISEEQELIDIDEYKSYDPVRKYLDEIGKFKTLTKEEEKALFIEYKDHGKQEAKEKIIKANLKLSVLIAKKYINFVKKLDFLDLIMEGNSGIIKAVECFDYNLGFKFSTYAYWWITRAIRVAIMNQNDDIRIPIHVHEKGIVITKKINEFELKYGREPSDNELMEYGDISQNDIETYKLYKSIKTGGISLNTHIGEEKDEEYGDFIPSKIDIDNEVDKCLAKDEIKALIEKAGLSKKEIDILYRRYGIGKYSKESLDQLGKRYKITRERVRQIEARALHKLSTAAKVNSKNTIKIQKPNAKYEEGLYSYYGEKYSIKKLINAYERLNINSKRIIITKFGKDLVKYNENIRLTRNDLAKLNEILSKEMIKAINDINYKEKEEQIKLYNYFSIYSKEEIFDVIDKFISIEELKLLERVFGKTLDENADFEKILSDCVTFNNILVEMQNRLMYIRKIKVEGKYEEQFRSRSLYEELNKYTKEQIDDAIIRLSEVKYNELMEIYNHDLNNKIVIIGSKKNQVMKFANIKSTIIELINNPNKQYKKKRD